MTTPRVCGDRWPVRVTLPDGSAAVGRVVLTVADDQHPAELYVWSREVVDGSPRLIAREPWTPTESSVPRAPGRWTITTSAGTYLVEATRACRCGSVFATDPWSPWRLVRPPRNLAHTPARLRGDKPAGRNLHRS